MSMSSTLNIGVWRSSFYIILITLVIFSPAAFSEERCADQVVVCPAVVSWNIYPQAHASVEISPDRLLAILIGA